MTGIRRLLCILPVLVLALATTMVATGTAQAAEGEPSLEWCQTNGGDAEGCPADQCPEVQGYQATNDLCKPVEQPAPTPTPAPAPTDVCPEVDGVQADASQCLPDEAPAPAVDIESESLTLQGVQHDNPATVGGEQTIAAVSAVSGSGSGAAAVSAPTGDLPYTGMTVTQVGILGAALLLLGSLAWTVGPRLRRRGTADLAA